MKTKRKLETFGPRHPVQRELNRLLKSSVNKTVVVADIVAWAKAHPESALHGRFVWDDREAANLWRVGQARVCVERCVKYKTIKIGRCGAPEMFSKKVLTSGKDGLKKAE